jgi:hypothetical protein
VSGGANMSLFGRLFFLVLWSYILLGLVQAAAKA